MRRTTLGPIAASDLNSSLLDVSAISAVGAGDGRKSLSTSGIGKMLGGTKNITAPGTGKKAASGRPSFAPGGTTSIGGAGNGDRRTSLFVSRPTLGGGAGGGGGVGLISRREVDPRPVMSSTFRNNAIKEIELFMIENECSHPISAAKLASPTMRDFQTVVTFLLRQLDANFAMSGKVEDEVTLVAKALHYPFMPSKTAITAVGAATTWPALLAMLFWLVELLRYDQGVKMQLADGTFGSAGEPEAVGTSDYFTWYLKHGYALFLAMEDEKLECLEADVNAAFDAQVEAMEDDIAAEEKELAALEAELAELQGTQSVLPALRADVRDIERDIETSAKTALELQEYARNLSMKRADVQAERDAAQAAVDKARHELDRVSHIVAIQELSIEDVRRMSGTKTALRDTKTRLVSSRNACALETDKLRLELRNKLDLLNAKVKDYHEAARSIQMVPLGAKWSSGHDWSLRVDERALERAKNPDYGRPEDTKEAAHALLGCENFKTGQKDHIRKLKAGLVTKAEVGRSALRKEADGITDLAERRRELTQMLTDAESTTGSLEATAKRESEAGEKRLKDGTNEMGRVEVNRNEKRIALAAAQAAARELSPAVLAELAAAIRHSISSQERERDAIKDTASRMALRVTEHTQRVKSSLEHASASLITAKNRQVTVEAERASRLQQVVTGTLPPSSFSNSFVGGNNNNNNGVSNNTSMNSSMLMSMLKNSAAPPTPSSAGIHQLPAIPTPSLYLPPMPSALGLFGSSTTTTTSSSSTTTKAGGVGVMPSFTPSQQFLQQQYAKAAEADIARILPFASPSGIDRSQPSRATSAGKKTPSRG